MGKSGESAEGGKNPENQPALEPENARVPDSAE